MEHLWDELGRAINSMDHFPHNFHELRQALLYQGAKIPVDHLQSLVASMPRWLAAIIIGAVTHITNPSTLEICN